MLSTKSPKQVRGEGLYAEREPIDPGLPKASEPVEVDAARIRLESNLGILDNGSCFSNTIQQHGYCVRRKEGGCSAAHEDRAHRASGKRTLLHSLAQLCQQRLCITFFGPLSSSPGVEIAIRAELQTPGDVEIDRNHAQ